MVRTGFQNGAYVILSIEEERDDVCTYIVRNREGKQFIACELRSLSLINKCLPEISRAAESDRLVCFTENACLYIITRYTEGEIARLYFCVNHTDLRRKLEMIRTMTFKMVECSDMPELITKGMLTEKSACVCRGELALNCFIDPNNTKSPVEMYAELFDGMFSPADIKRLKYLSIVMQKLSNGIYSSFLEIYLDIEQLIDKLDGGTDILGSIKAAYERSKSVIRIVATAAVLVAAAVVIYNMVMKSSQEAASENFEPIDHIGTVRLDGEESTVQDIHVTAE